MRGSGLWVLWKPWLPGGLTAIWLGMIFLVSGWPDPVIPALGLPSLVRPWGQFWFPLYGGR